MTKAPSSRELQLLAALASQEGSDVEGAELTGRQIAKIYEDETAETMSYGMVYTILADLEEAGLVKSRDDVHDGRPTRWYRLSQSGLDAVPRRSNPAESTDAAGAEHPAPRRTGS